MGGGSFGGASGELGAVGAFRGPCVLILFCLLMILFLNPFSSFKLCCSLASWLPRAIESTVGELSLFFDKASSALWIGGDSPGKVPASTELLGYGSGDIQDGPTAADLISDPSGRWFVYELSTFTTQIIVEADRKLPSEIRSLPVFQKANDFRKWNPP